MSSSAATNPLEALTSFISSGLAASEGDAKTLLQALFGGPGRYTQQSFKAGMLRDAYGLAGADSGDGVRWAGVIHPDTPPSGPYGGTSLVWFPTHKEGSLIGLVVGTRGLPPDEGILPRPGHRRRIAALRRYLS